MNTRNNNIELEPIKSIFSVSGRPAKKFKTLWGRVSTLNSPAIFLCWNIYKRDDALLIYENVRNSSKKNPGFFKVAKYPVLYILKCLSFQKYKNTYQVTAKELSPAKLKEKIEGKYQIQQIEMWSADDIDLKAFEGFTSQRPKEYLEQLIREHVNATQDLFESSKGYQINATLPQLKIKSTSHKIEEKEQCKIL